MADEELETYLEEQLGVELIREEDPTLLLPEYPSFLPPGAQMGGEDDLSPHWLDVGEGGEDRGFLPLRELEKEKVDVEKAQLCQQFYEIMSERQELRRKNAFLQKKMVEFYKKRKMDHLLKEDPKGLDMENKYLKRLLEVKHCIASVEEGKRVINEKVEDVSKKAVDLKGQVQKEQNDFFEKQRKVALGLRLKTERKISTRAIANFLAIQAANTDELSRLRLKEIKIKRLLAQSQEMLKELDSLGHGLRRADYEQLIYEYQNESRKYTERTQETEKLKAKAQTVSMKLHQAQHRATMLDKELTEWQQRTKEMKEQVTETKQRLYKIGKMRDSFKKAEDKLKKNSGLLTIKPLLLDFEISLSEAGALKEKLEQEEAISKARQIRAKGGQVNTPTEFLVESPHVIDLLEAAEDD